MPGQGLFEGNDLLVGSAGEVPGVAHHLLDEAHHGMDIWVADTVPQALEAHVGVVAVGLALLLVCEVLMHTLLALAMALKLLLWN